jgi:hypothetical protein
MVDSSRLQLGALFGQTRISGHIDINPCATRNRAFWVKQSLNFRQGIDRSRHFIGIFLNIYSSFLSFGRLNIPGRLLRFDQRGQNEPKPDERQKRKVRRT